MDVFVFGTLCHAPLRAIVLGDHPARGEVPASLPGYATHRAKDADYPLLSASPGQAAEGLLLQGLDDVALARIDFFEGGFAYGLVDAEVEVAGTRRPAMRYGAPEGTLPDGPWSLTAWIERSGDFWCAVAEEAMSYFGAASSAELAARLPMIRQRAASRLRAQAGAPTTLRSAFDARGDVDVVVPRRPYAKYFSLAEYDLRYRRFDGAMSDVVNRAGFVGGDAVTVLPYDPETDEVLVVEQFRVGPFLRGDPLPWMLEPVAGRVDPGETVEDTARRETLEEAGLSLRGLHFVNGHYPSPGAVTEFVYAFVAIASLTGKNGTVAGLDTEDENIRSHVIAFDRLMSLVESGEAGCGPLVISAYWLALNRTRLRSA